MVEGSGEEVV
jgi:hypothetical protein